VKEDAAPRFLDLSHKHAMSIACDVNMDPDAFELPQELKMLKTVSTSAVPLRRPIVLQADRDEFRRCFGVSAFALRHSLADNPLFSLPRLAKVAERCSGRSHIADGLPNVDAKFSEMKRRGMVVSAIEDLQASNSWIKISNIGGSEPEYAELQTVFLKDVQDLSGQPILDRVTWSTVTVFLASPNIVTPIHIDHELNFLCQVTGERDVCLFDPKDREFLPDEDIERFYFGDLTGLRYREQFQPRGRMFRLMPGIAVHQPPLAAHWLKNGPHVSIGVSLSCCTRDIDRQARIYQVNYCLRKAGLRPKPPGRSAVMDGLKAGLMGLLAVRKPKSYQEAVHSGPNKLKAFAKRCLFRQNTR
jgi:hypothetical protein